MGSYDDFLSRKFQGFHGEGADRAKPVSDRLFPYQVAAVDKLLGCGRGAAFLDTGMGKTAIQIEWLRQLDVRSLVVCPLAVADQTIKEAEMMGVEITRGGSKIEIINYDRLHQVEPGEYEAVVFDESSIMKSFDSRTRQLAESIFGNTKYRLACSATPSPNDYLEIGQQSQVLGILRSIDMLSRWFINDSANTGTWRLKGHATSSFWRWVNSWAAVAAHPSDLGDSITDLSLPDLHEVESIVPEAIEPQGDLFGTIELSATGIKKSKQASLPARVERCRELADGDDYALVWCDTNEESKDLSSIPGAIEVRGDMSREEKESRLLAFSRGDERVLVTKPSIAGFGLNWQHCNNVIFAGANYSFERYYQAVRRCWRFGQKRPVTASVVMTPNERLIWMKTREKAERHQNMIQEIRKVA